MKKNKNLYITEISEEDFRKLDIVAYEMKMTVDRFAWVPIHINDVLDQSIKAAYDSGYESDLEDLQCPFTVAINKGNCEKPEDYYLDKFMNRFSGARTYQVGCGIKHLFSTRDYYESHEDYWRVLKRETKSIYRVHLDSKWAKMFKLKHKTETVPWQEVYPGEEANWKLSIYYDYDEESGEWRETYRYKLVKTELGTMYIPVDKNGQEIKHK